MPLSLKSTLPYTLVVDGQPVRLIYKRMDPIEFAVFDAQFKAFTEDRPNEPAEGGLPDAPGGLTATQRARLEANDRWLRETFKAYVTVQEGDLTLDGHVVTDGEALYGLIGSAPQVLSEVLANLYIEHVLTDQQKKTSRLRSASATGSTPAPAATASGARPARAAGGAAKKASARRGAATRRSPGSSGTTADAVSSASAPSGH